MSLRYHVRLAIVAKYGARAAPIHVRLGEGLLNYLVRHEAAGKLRLAPGR